MARTVRRTALGILAAGLAVLAGCSNEAPAPDAPKTAEERVVETARPQSEERLVLAFGDSLYAGYGLKAGEGLPAQVEDRLRAAGINATVVDAGVSGDTTAAGRQRLAFTLDGLECAPDLVILGLGGNDALRQIAPDETRANMVAMMEELKRRKIPVLLTGMRAPPNLGPDYARVFEPIWPDLAKTYNAGLYPFILEGVITDPSLMQGDGVHPAAAGVERMADAIARQVLVELPQKAP